MAANSPLHRKISLDDKFALDTARAYMTGIDALVRLPMLQRQRDQQAGLNTAGFISGYRGSPLGSIDQALWNAQAHLDKHQITFQPGVNEDLAATSVWGSQQVNLYPGARYDGVFSMWYGKGPGVDRSMDVIRHANAFGTAKHGGVLAVAGDDHAAKSSTLPHQTEHMFMGASIPVLSPANVQEVLDLGILGWEMSRYCGSWVALKAITENMDSAISAEIDPNRVNIVIPEDFELPPEGVHGRLGSTPLEQEYIMQKYRIYAARQFAKVNHINRITIDSAVPRLGIITSGKSYLDVMQALEDLGIGESLAGKIGLRVLKVGMSWPLEPVSTHEFARGLEEILVVEEKRSIIEDQLTGQLYNWPVAKRPRVIGEFDEQGNDLLVNYGELTPAMIARAIAARIAKFYDSDTIHKRLTFLEAKERTLETPRVTLNRTPHYCSGCPHNTSTVVPEGSRAGGGIGCHYMVTWMDRETHSFTQMGGEGAQWIGQAPFTEEQHIFQNLGDGTYFHSGLLAMRAAISSGVNITYKILYNDAVAMTGGQPHDGPLSVPMIIDQVRAEGVKRIALVSDDIDKYKGVFSTNENVTVDHRDELDAVQRELREVSGTSVIIYDQTCAAEKRRRRKKGKMEDPAKRVFINEDVCEGCGDCSVKSNCLSVLPKETELGRKREIDQSACNKDISCVKGFCPSFVTVHGGQLKKKNAVSGLNTDVLFTHLPDPQLPEFTTPWNVLVTGVGGTGVLTISGILAMAAHIEGKGVATMNQTGLAQKFGAVVSHVRIGHKQEDIYAVRIAAGDADLLLGCDLVVANADDAIAKLHRSRSNAVINDFEAPTAGFINDPDIEFPADAMKQLLRAEVGEDKTHFINATSIASALLGDTIASNLFLLGYAFQRGLVPVAADSIVEAIELNAVAVDFNQQAFLWGRRAAYDMQAVTELAKPKSKPRFLTALDDVIEWRRNALVQYQNKAYADEYLSVVKEVRAKEASLLSSTAKASTDEHAGEKLPLTYAVARNLYKLMAYKDEYEVARLYTDGSFERRLREQFEGDFTLKFHLAPPLFSKKDSVTGHLIKKSFPQVTFQVFRLLARFKGLRGSALDMFGYTSERREERALISEFKIDISAMLAELSTDNIEHAIAIARLPESIRGYGHVKEASMAQAKLKKPGLFDRFYGRDNKVVRIYVQEAA